MNPADTIEARIRRRYPEMSEADRKLADVLVVQDRQLAAYTATELAALAGVSKASMARFIRRLGFTDFNAFRQQAREQVSEESPLYLMQQDGAEHSLAQHAQADAARLLALAGSIDEPTLERAVDLLARARRVWVAGYRNSHMTAFYAHALLAQARSGAHLLNDAAARDADILADIATDDLLLAVDFRRRTRRMAQVARIAAESGARIVVLTDSSATPLAERADAVLRCPHPGSPIFDSYVAAVSLVNLLATRLVGRTRDAARARAARIERIHEMLDDLDTPY